MAVAVFNDDLLAKASEIVPAILAHNGCKIVTAGRRDPG